MAEDEDGVSNRKSYEKPNNEGISEDSEQNTQKPDLGIEEANYNISENHHSSSEEAKSSASKASGAVRKEENPFSFRHFLKRDLSLPSNSTYENTGARPKVYASTVQHSPSRGAAPPAGAAPPDPRRDKARSLSQTKEKNRDGDSHQISDTAASSSSTEAPFSVVDSSDSKQNLFIDNSESSFYHRPNLASEPLGMPSLPDFVQDHILVEQAYLNSNGPISLDLDNLPDFTFNTNFNSGSSSLGRRNNSGYSGSRNYDYDAYGAASTSESGPSGRLSEGLEAAAAPLPLDLPPHLNLDLTESVNPADRRNNSPRNPMDHPLDLPPNAAAEAMRLPDFLPLHGGRSSPAGRASPRDQHEQLLEELEQARSELFIERGRRSRLEGEAAAAHDAAAALRAELRRQRGAEGGHDAAQVGASEAESTISRLKNQIKKLKEELAASQAEARALRGGQARAARDLRQASAVAETSLRELLSGLEQLKSLSSALDPP
ncbi:unnamed protein product [Plutella xylostella]|uniref:(diamondback moth) hypothetical protein n=1 Tax=Plutella xylostella TaxID=51655 RepID=A0A8S4D3W9_PLUXY|nr:unnamed protein product [Plutella xylostella]